MNVKKLTILAVAVLASTLALTACGQKKEADSKSQNQKKVDINKDAVSTKTKTVDGKEVKEYTMPDGNIVQVPADGGEVTDSSDTDSNEE